MFIASLYSIRKLKLQVDHLLELEKSKYDPAVLTVDQQDTPGIINTMIVFVGALLMVVIIEIGMNFISIEKAAQDFVNMHKNNGHKK